MKAGLVTALRESCGYLEDESWHQTAELMTLAADEIERLSMRVGELEDVSSAREKPAETRRPLAIVSRR